MLTQPTELAAAGLALFLAYGLRAVTGFGSALVAVPMLSLFLPLQMVVPWVVALDVAAAFLLTGASWRKKEVDWGEIRWLLPPALLGIPLEFFLFALILIGIAVFHHQTFRVALTGVSMPVFWLGLVLIMIFSVGLGWFPTGGRMEVRLFFQPITRLFLLEITVQYLLCSNAPGLCLEHLLIGKLVLEPGDHPIAPRNHDLGVVASGSHRRVAARSARADR